MTGKAHLQFVLDDVAFALPLETVDEVLPLPKLSRPPHSPPALAGLCQVGESTLAVLRLRDLLGMAPQPPGLYAHLVRLRSAAPEIALLVDRVAGVRPTQAFEWHEASEADSFRGCVSGTLANDDEVMHVLAMDRLISEHERQRIGAFVETERDFALAFEAEA